MILKTPFVFSEHQSNIFWVALITTLIIGFFIPRTLAFLPSAVGIIFFITAYFKNKTILKINKSELILFGFLLSLAFLSSTWSVNSVFSLEKSLKLLLMICLGIFLLAVSRNIKAPPIKPIYIAFIFLIVLFALFLISQEITEYHLMKVILEKDNLERSKLNRTYIVFAFFSLITQWVIKISNYTKQQKLLSLLPVFIISSYSLFLAESQTAQLSYICGLFSLFVWPIKFKKIGKILFGGLILLCFILPCAIKPIKNNVPEEIINQGILAHASIVHRFEVWEFTVNKIKESPLYGHGIESQRFMKSDKWMVHQKADSILHAHNIILQIWIEFGLIGIFLGIGFLIYFYKKIYNEEDLQKRNLYLTIFTTGFCCAMTGYGVWQGWQIGFFFVITATVIALTNNKKSKS